MTVEDFSEPVLAGEGASDYERYLRTDEVLVLQKSPEEQVHRDELLFQTVDQAGVTLRRMRHDLVVVRMIGDSVVGTQGTPVELLGGLIEQRFYPELWQARSRLTELANEEG